MDLSDQNEEKRHRNRDDDVDPFSEGVRSGASCHLSDSAKVSRQSTLKPVGGQACYTHRNNSGTVA